MQTINGHASEFFDNLITMRELLELFKLQYSRKSIYRWVSRHGFPHRRIMGKLWFPKSEVLLWVSRRSK